MLQHNEIHNHPIPELTMREEAVDSDNVSILAFFDHLKRRSGEKPIQLSDEKDKDNEREAFDSDKDRSPEFEFFLEQSSCHPQEL